MLGPSASYERPGDVMRMADRLVVMNAGRNEQLGISAELFDRPRTTFVARFIGSPGMSLLDSATIAAQGTQLPESVPQSGCTIGIRPEDIVLGEDARPALSLSGQIGAVEILGKESLVYVSGFGDLVTVKAAGGRWQPGATVTLSQPFEHIHLFDAKSGSAVECVLTPKSEDAEMGGGSLPHAPRLRPSPPLLQGKGARFRTT